MQSCCSLTKWSKILTDPNITYVTSDLAEVIGIAIIVIAVILVIVTIAVCWTVCEVARGRQETELKRDMLDRGMSVDEIERVIKATAPEVKHGGKACGT